MFISLAREHHWSPGILGDLFFDEEDYLGLRFWYNDLEEVNRQLKAAASKTK